MFKVFQLSPYKWVHFANRLLVYCYLEFKLCCLKNLKIIWAYSFFWGKKKPTGFLLFLKAVLRNQSLSNARWFYSKKCNIGKKNPYSTENRLKKTCDVQQIITMQQHMCKGIFRFELLQLLTKYQIFMKLPQISHIHKSHKKHNWRWID